MDYFVMAYMVVWLVLFGYLFFISNKNKILFKNLHIMVDFMEHKKEKG